MYCINENNIPGFAVNKYYLQKTNGRLLSNQLHTHTFYEFFYIVSGVCIHERNGTQERLSSGDLAFLSPQISHRFLSQSADTDLIAISVVTDEIDIFLKAYGLNTFSVSAPAFNLAIENRSQLLQLYENVVAADTKEYTMRVRMLLNQIFLYYLESTLKKAYMPPNFAALIEKMHHPDLACEGVTAMLRLSGYSHSQLCRLTKKYLGMSPTEYINQIRMKHAYELIVHSDTAFEGICETVGFESFSYFCKLVKKNFGCSAAKLRKGTRTISKTL